MRLNTLIPTDKEIEVTGICYDSRNVKKGDLFVAIEGYKLNGESFINDAVSKGAVCIVSEKEVKCSVPLIKVSDARVALAEIAHKFYENPASKIKLIGVTGTNGKTTVTHLVHSVLEKCGFKTGLIGTNYILSGDRVIPSTRTTPESLDLVRIISKMVQNGCEYAVMEVSSHSLELKRVHMCNFETGAFTNLTQDHLDFHGTMENYLKAKAKLFDISKNAVINIDDSGGRYIMQSLRNPVTTYGIYNGDVSAIDVNYTRNGVSFNCEGNHFNLGIPGKFSVYNALCAISICKTLGISMDKVAKAFGEFKGVKGRMEVVPTDRNFTVIIDYAHTPDGLLNVLKSVRQTENGRIIALFGCGGDRDKSKRAKMGKIAGEYADFCIVTSDNPRTEEPSEIIRDILVGLKDTSAPYVVVENRRDAIEYALMHAEDNDVIILAGKGHEDYQELNGQKIHFDEREIVAEILSQN